MQVGSVIKYYGSVGVITEIVDAVRFPNNTPCKQALVHFSKGNPVFLDTGLSHLEVICK